MTTATAPAPLLWTRGQVRRLLAADVVAAGVILLGAWRAAAADDTHPAQGWLIVSALGLGLSGLLHGGWIARHRRIVRSAIGGLPTQVRVVVGASAAVDVASTDGELVAVPGSMRYHRRDCALASGRELIALSVDDETLAARYACEVCRP